MLNNIASILGVGGGVATDYESIQTVTVGAGGSATVSFTSIPSTYTHLQIRGLLKNTNATSTDDPTHIRFNSDSATNYSYHSVYGNGTSAAALNGVTQAQMLSYGTPSNNFTSVFGGAIIDILDYANTNKFKTLRWLNGFNPNSSTTSIDFTSGNWRSTSAITSINIITPFGNWATGTTFALYGIK